MRADGGAAVRRNVHEPLRVEHQQRLTDGCPADAQLSRELVKENLLFHQAILDGSGSGRLTAMVRQVIELPLVYRSYVWYSPEQQRISAHYHVQITRALESRDAERAELVMKEHIFEARDLLLTHWRELEAPT